jgi:DNA-directed RNA polymerase subunit RPC12/RpoP
MYCGIGVNVICPHCGHVIEAKGWLPMEPNVKGEKAQCVKCGKAFTWSRRTNVEYTTTKDTGNG